MNSEIKNIKPKGMYLDTLLKRLGCGKTTFYTKYSNLIEPKRIEGKKNKVYMLEDVEKLEKHIADSQEIEIIKE